MEKYISHNRKKINASENHQKYIDFHTFLGTWHKFKVRVKCVHTMNRCNCRGRPYLQSIDAKRDNIEKLTSGPGHKSHSDIPANARRWANAGLMLVQRRRRWTNIKPALIQRFMSARSLIFYHNLHYNKWKKCEKKYLDSNMGIIVVFNPNQTLIDFGFH